jgi:hypothetical protein
LDAISTPYLSDDGAIRVPFPAAARKKLPQVRHFGMAAETA